MRLSNTQLKRIIQEEMNFVLQEVEDQKTMDKWKETPEEEKEGWLDKVANFLMRSGEYAEKKKMNRRGFLDVLKKLGFGGVATAAVGGPLVGLKGYLSGTKQAAEDRAAEEEEAEYEREYRLKTGTKFPQDLMPVKEAKWSQAPAGDRLYGQYVWIDPKDLRDDLMVPSQGKRVAEVKKEISKRWGSNDQQLEQILRHISDSKSYGYSQSKEKRLFDQYPGAHYGDVMDWSNEKWDENSHWFQDDLAGQMMLPVIFSVTVQVARERWLPELYSIGKTEQGFNISEEMAKEWSARLLYSNPSELKSDLQVYDKVSRGEASDEEFDSLYRRKEKASQQGLSPF